MTPAARIKGGPAIRAGVVAVEIGLDGQFRATGAAHDRPGLPLARRPALDRMRRKCIMTIFAGKIPVAALHPDGDDVERRMPVGTSRLRIEFDTEDVRSHGPGASGHDEPC